MKKMKFNYKYLLIPALVFSMSSCSDYLDKNPTDKLSPSSFWKTKGDVEYALTAVYSTLQVSQYSYGAPNFDNITDNGYGQHNYDNSSNIAQGNISSTTGGYISSIYSTAYRGIARVNIFLKNLSEYTAADISDLDRKNYQAEAKFIRAYYYFQLYLFYGSVPLVTEPLDLETQFQEKTEAKNIYAHIIKDLDEAIAVLSDVAYADKQGHAVKSSAQALKLRVIMNDAFTSKTVADAAKLAEAEQVANALISKGLYTLDTDYVSTFQDASQKNSKEIMFSINFLAPNNSTGMDMWYGDWMVVSPLQNLVDSYDYIDGLAYGVSPLTDKTDPFKNRDPRLGKTIFKGFVQWPDGKIHRPSNGGPTGFGLKKFLSPDLVPYGYSTRSQQDWVMLRYADVLLLAAEIENELKGPTTKALNYVNTVRKRAGMPNFPTGLSKDQFRERLRKERRIELAFEGLRFYDLKRWKIAEDVLNKVTDGIIPYSFETKFYRWPFPQTEIDKSQGKLVQNPDYSN